MRMKALAAALMVSALFISPVAAQDPAIEAKAKTAFAPVMADYKIPGLVVGITRNGEHTFYSAGLASRADNRAVTPDTIFELGSLSKIFNVTLAALAEQEGKLSLSDKVARYVCDNACSIGDDMTLMDLATHHSGGLPLQVPDGLANTNDLVNWLKRWQPPRPGTRSYSNVSIGLLGHIVAQALGLSYEQAVTSMIFAKAGMTNTWISVPAKAMPNYAFGYDNKTEKPIRVTPGVLDAEAYGVKSNARDMLDFLDLELGRGKPPASLEAAILRTREGQFKTAKFVQDMIWEQYPWPVDLETLISGNGSDFILHPQQADRIAPPFPPQVNVILDKTGSTNGFGGYIAVLPGQDLGIVVLANKNYPNEARVRATYALIEAILSR